MAGFFTQAAFVTFGGAYAVLPYVRHAAVETHGWLREGEMMDGLALGETTPGPLIMVVAFVGFVGGWRSDPGWGGLLGSAVATWFTFLPSILFILLGAPTVERTRHVPALHAPLAAVSAAVVGVIANLAVLFGRHTLFEVRNGFDPFAAALAAGALFGLLRLRWNVVLVVVGCGLAGLLRGLLLP
jgi:chromate transporter